MTPAIAVANLSKRYRIGARQQQGYRTLREAITETAAAPLRTMKRFWNKANQERDAIWALKDVSFEVQPGEVVGIIGRNGAGKSTLLKILSHITEPTDGRVTLHGRVGSLLEVGTGFHPELTGRENIFLNGAILGMTRREIRRKFDEIVAFAEIAQFLDTPVKHFSSGMYMRLAFAVAAHLEPEILLVDEVLAVGDAAFQRRCLDYMGQLARSGRTIILVSHDMNIVPRLCSTAILLDRGHLRQAGCSHEVVDAYLSLLKHPTDEDDLAGKNRTGDGRARFADLKLTDATGTPIHAHASGADLTFQIAIESTCDLSDVALAINVHTLSGARLLSSWTKEHDMALSLTKGRNTIRCCFFSIPLRPGHSVSVGLWMESHGVIDSVEDAKIIQIVDGLATSHLSPDKNQGIFAFASKWSRITETD